MKKLLIASTLFLMLGCKDGEVPSVTDVEILKTGESYLTDALEPRIQVKAIGIQDNRCPINAICVWTGYAQVKFEVTVKGQTLQDSLATPAVPAQNLVSRKHYRLGGEEFGIVLKEVNPYPGSTKPGEEEPEKTAILEVTRY